MSVPDNTKVRRVERHEYQYGGFEVMGDCGVCGHTQDSPIHDALLQYRYREDAWRIFVCCILLNQTTRAQVDRVVRRVFALWPDAYAMRDASLRALARELAGQGMEWVKAGRLIRMSDDYVVWYETGAMLPDQIHGVGQYAIDSYDIFFCKAETDVPSGDKELLAYVGRKA